MLKKSIFVGFIKVKRGFLLLELMIAFFIIALIASASSGWYISTLHAQKASFLRLKALLLARSIMEYSKMHGIPDKKKLILLFKPEKKFKITCTQKLLGDSNIKNGIEKCTVQVSYAVRQKIYTVTLVTMMLNKQ